MNTASGERWCTVPLMRQTAVMYIFVMIYKQQRHITYSTNITLYTHRFGRTIVHCANKRWVPSRGIDGRSKISYFHWECPRWIAHEQDVFSLISLEREKVCTRGHARVRRKAREGESAREIEEERKKGRVCVCGGGRITTVLAWFPWRMQYGCVVYVTSLSHTRTRTRTRELVRVCRITWINMHRWINVCMCINQWTCIHTQIHTRPYLTHYMYMIINVIHTCVCMFFVYLCTWI